MFFKDTEIAKYLNKQTFCHKFLEFPMNITLYLVFVVAYV